jgi:hypothetical protein
VIVALLLATVSFASNYCRTEDEYIIRNNGSCYDLADKFNKWANEDQLNSIAWDTAVMNHVNDIYKHLSNGKRVRVPIYSSTSKFFKGDLRNWHIAIVAGTLHNVSPNLLIAIRTHENPSSDRDDYGYGVKVARGTDLRTQAIWSAKIIRRFANSDGSDANGPTKYNVISYGKRYAEGSTEWGQAVWSLYKRTKGE